MLASVHFDDEVTLMTRKIDYVPANRYLPAKTQPIQSMRSERRPQSLFCISHFPAQ